MRGFEALLTNLREKGTKKGPNFIQEKTNFLCLLDFCPRNE